MIYNMFKVLLKPLVHATWISKAIQNWFAIKLCILQIKFNFLKFFSSFIQIKNLLYTNPWTLCPIHGLYGDWSHWLGNLCFSRWWKADNSLFLGEVEYDSFFFFLKRGGFFHGHSRFTGQQGKGEAISLNFRTITAESSLWHIASTAGVEPRIFGFWVQFTNHYAMRPYKPTILDKIIETKEIKQHWAGKKTLISVFT